MRAWLLGVGLLGGCFTEFIDPPTGPACAPNCRDDALVALDSGGRASCAVGLRGELFCWGRAGSTALGPGVESAETPALVDSGPGWNDVRTSPGFQGHTCGIREGGELFCWGSNLEQQLGNCGAGTSAEFFRVNDQQWRSVDVGLNFTCAIRQDRSLWCWGLSGAGQFGIDTNQQCPPVPVAPASDWDQVRLGRAHACAIRGPDALWCWGIGSEGQTGFGPTEATEPRQLPDFRVRVVATGTDHTCAIDRGGALHCWGANVAGQLGHSEAPGPARVGDRNDWVSVAAGLGHSCGVIADGTLFCWGDNSEGQLGRGARGSGPLEIAPVLGDQDYQFVTAGDSVTCATKTDGSLWCWGLGDRDGSPGGTTTIPTALALP
ncbi:MAG: hypothetical protein AAGF12_00290 [Myxococcota bacterium]